MMYEGMPHALVDMTWIMAPNLKEINNTVPSI